MKKLALSIAALAFIATSMTSCKKDYTCTCTIDFLGVKTTVSETAKMTKKDAKAWCEDENTTGVTCELK